MNGKQILVILKRLSLSGLKLSKLAIGSEFLVLHCANLEWHDFYIIETDK